ncbi:MAG: Csu type fimbrial protein [Croceibacterium sp.]
MIRKLIFAALLLFFGTGVAHANGSCTPTSAGISFGTFTGSQVTNIGSIVLTCSGNGNINYTVTLTAGNGTYATRLMKKGTPSLSYNLYKDAVFGQIWGDGTGGSTTLTGSVNVNTSSPIVTIPLYAKLPAQALPAQGGYSDTITVSVAAQTTITASFLVTAVVQPACTISATNLAFGTYANVQKDAQSQISLTCTNYAAWNLGLNAGTFTGATVSTRKMTGPSGSSMAYSLYRDSPRTLNWGNTVGTDTVAGTGTGSAQTVPVYGRIPASQTLPSGNYQDTIIATVTF